MKIFSWALKLNIYIIEKIKNINVIIRQLEQFNIKWHNFTG